MSRKKATIWNFAFLNIGFIVSIVNGVLIIPLYLHYINSSVYGAWLATGNVLTWITIVDPGVSNVLLQRVAFAIGKEDKKEAGLSITSGVLISLVLFVIAVLLGYIFSFFIGDIAKIDPAYRGDIIAAFRIALWGTALSLLADTFRNVILAYQKTKIHGIFLNSIVIASIALNVGLLMNGFGIYALAYSSLFRGIAILLFALIYTASILKNDKISLIFNKSYFRSFSSVFAYTFSSRLFETLASNVDLIIVSRYLGAHAVTVLDLSRRPIKILSGLTNTVTQSMLPTLPHLFGSGDTQKIQSTILKVWNIIIWLSVFVIGAFLVFNYNLISLWVGADFWIGSANNIILCLSFLFLCVGYNLSNITLSMGDIRNNSIINMIRGGSYIVLLVLFAKFWGMSGVLVAFLISLIVMIYYFPRKIIRSSMNANNVKLLSRDLVVVLAFLVLCISFSYTNKLSLNWLQLVLGGSIYTGAFITFLFALSPQFRKEIQYIPYIVKQKFVKAK